MVSPSPFRRVRAARSRSANVLGELERLERRVIELEVLVKRVLLQQEKILELLLPPTTYPRSSGGTITVK